MRCYDSSNLFIKLGITLLVIRIFFSTVGYLSFGYPIIEFLIFVMMLCNARINKNKLSISFTDRLMWFAFIFFTLFTSFFSVEVVGTFRFSLLYIFIISITIFLDTIEGWQRRYIKITLNLSILFTVSTILLYIFEDKFLGLVSFLYTSEQLNKIILMYSRNFYSGIGNQVGFTGFFISIGVLIVFSRYMTNKRNIYLFGMLFMFTGLILTAKRGFLVAIVLTMIFVYVLSLRGKRKHMFVNFFNIIKALIGVFIVGLIFYNVFIPTMTLYDRFFLTTDFTSGRVYIYGILYDMFLDRPIIGHGFNFFNRYMYSTYGSAIDGHNIYLQLLTEVGIIGFCFILSAFIVTFIRTLKIFYKENDSEIKFYLLVSISVQLFFILYGFVGNPIYDHQFFMIYMFSTSLMYMNNKVVNVKQKPANFIK